MVHTLKQLESGELKGVKRLKLACGLNEFPKSIFTLSDSLEILDLSDNNLSELPDNISDLKHLKIIFFAKNKFKEFPKALAKCSVLSMIGFKSNQITSVPENAFPLALRWLILTDNKIKELPKSIGDCTLLQKCALAGNLIKELPAEMSKCVNLELLRTSANKLTELPNWLFSLPKLSWVAFGGNPASFNYKLNNDLASFNWDDFNVNEVLGEGASGVISKAHWLSKQKDVAVKVFKGAVTSDGLPEDELKVSISAGSHDSLIPILGKVKSHPEGRNGLIMKLISPDYTNLGNPPSLESCTRDVYENDVVYTYNELFKIAKSIASVCEQLHSKGINHGDLYAHNILINNEADCLLGDFGAASFYNVNSPQANNIERVEVRAFGCLIEDIFSLIENKQSNTDLFNKWKQLIANCMKSTVSTRFSFAEIIKELNKF